MINAYNILIADADAGLRHCLKRVLEEDPLLNIAWEAENGLQALHLTLQHQPQLILMDAHLPRMDGFELTRILRQRIPKLCVVIMSVYEQVRSQAVDAGADDFIAKDCGSVALRTHLRNLIDNQHAFKKETVE